MSSSAAGFSRIAALLACLAAAPTAHATLTVGNTAGCQYAKIQDAIDAAAESDVIRVEPSHTYYEHLLIQDKSLAISSCPCDPAACKSQPTPPPHVSIDGYSAIKVVKPVLRIQTSGSNTSTTGLAYVDISNGNSGGTDGGGISWAAAGKLTLNDVLVNGNNANYGAGINFDGTGAGATLAFGRNVSVSFNDAATSGGGVRLEGHATLLMDGNNDQIFLNSANGGYGGGIEVISPAHAHIGTAVPGLPAVYSNEAAYGGGIAIVGSQSDSSELASSASVSIDAADLRYPVRIEGNRATATGGGVYLKPYVFSFVTTTVNFASLSARGYRIDGNSAVEGSAVYADTDTAVGQDYYGGSVTLTRATCLAHVDCDTIAGNKAEDVNLVATSGSAVLMQTSAVLDATGVFLRGNAGAHALRVVGAFDATLDTSVVSGNSVTAALIEIEGGLEINQCTIAGNAIGGGAVIDSPGQILLWSSLIDQPGVAALDYRGDLESVHDIVATDTAGLPAGATIEQQRPYFVDAAHDDYRLVVVRNGDGSIFASQGVDFAAAGTAGETDIGGRPRDVDIAGVGTNGKPRDLGAYEMQAFADRIFASGFGDPVALAY